MPFHRKKRGCTSHVLLLIAVVTQAMEGADAGASQPREVFRCLSQKNTRMRLCILLLTAIVNQASFLRLRQTLCINQRCSRGPTHSRPGSKRPLPAAASITARQPPSPSDGNNSDLTKPEPRLRWKAAVAALLQLCSD